ncbi:MAG: NUDIX pyrophosphatase [Ignavibacteriales bacterium CG18_big_fil_WC_8_21_14_2_50_31_20]|nr:MAG: NUDIX pyrophosphatase [Ignavibacteriales bacterium CG18_big_fil_WC_8_21_14_2_50_31_20]
MTIKSTLIEAHVFRRIHGKIEFLVMKRAETEIYPNVWQMVTGSIEKGEKAYQTAIREIIEETTLAPKSFWIVPKVNSFYSAKDDSINLVPVFLAEVGLEYKVILSLEHSEYLWCGKEKAKKLFAWPGQRESVDIISECLSDEKSMLKLIKL